MEKLKNVLTAVCSTCTSNGHVYIYGYVL